MNTQRNHPGLRLALRITLALALLIGVFPVGFIAQAQTTTSTDPAAEYIEWPDDEIFFITPPLASNDASCASGQKIFTLEATSDLATINQKSSQCRTPKYDAIGAASGHILSAKQETVAYAYGKGGTTSQDLDVRVRWSGSGITDPETILSNMAARVAGGSDFFDLAVGDLDHDVAADGHYRDEVVVAYAKYDSTNKLPIRVVVLPYDFVSGKPQPLAQVEALSAGKLDAASIKSGTIKPVDNALSVITGDFNNDTIDEIAVAYLSAPQVYTIDIFRYTTTYSTSGVVTRTLTRILSHTDTYGYNMQETISIAAGDFDDNGWDELAVGVVYNDATYGQQGMVWMYQYACADNKNCTTSPNLTMVNKIRGLDGQYTCHDTTLTKIELAAGVFIVAPESGYNYTYNQVAVAYNDMGTKIKMAWAEETVGGWAIRVGPYVSLPASSTFSLAAGSFQGLQTADDPDPEWSLALARWSGTSYNLDLLLTNHASTPTKKANMTGTTAAYASGSRIALADVDLDGDTVYIGPPMRMIVSDMQNLKFILQEPPKHAYWNKWGNPPSVVNVNRLYDFNISLNASGNVGFTSTTKKHSDYTVGGSVYGSLNASTKIGKPLNKKELGAKISATIGYDYSYSYDEYNSAQTGYGWDFGAATNGDDVISLTKTYLEIWRYPVYGFPEVDSQGNPSYTYVDITMPGSSQEVPATNAGKDIQGWEPVWENGNILSYPLYTGTAYMPPDLGSYFIPCVPGPADCKQVSDDPPTYQKEITTPMAWGEYTTAPIDQKFELSMNYGESSGNSYTSTDSFSGSLDASGYIAKGNAFTGKDKFEIGLDFHGNGSWSDTTSQDSTSSTERKLYLTSPANVDSKYAYYYYPVLYVTKDGVFKLTYAVNPLGSTTGQGWWKSMYGDTSPYGAKPDPALNLPNRFEATFSTNGIQNGWIPNTHYYRDYIRGFWIKEATKDPDVNDYLVLSHAPIAGEKVRLEVRVLNYSLASTYNATVASLPVFFYATFTDPVTRAETRQDIGTAYITNLKPLEPQIAAIDWIPAASVTPGNCTWKVHVQLDPNNTISEIYDTTDAATYPCPEPDCVPAKNIDPGQNNYGFREVTVNTPSGVGDPRVYVPKDVNLKGEALVALNRNGTLDSGTTQAYLYKQMPIRIQVSSDFDSIYPSEVLLYDGDPANGGVLIASRLVYPGSKPLTGNAVWVLWTPMTKGPHTLYAVVKESSDDLQPGNNIATLKVVVIKEPQGPKP